MNTNCKNQNGCSVRIANGLRCFCDPTLTVTWQANKPGEFPTQEAALAVANGRAVVRVCRNFGHSPAVWIIR